ncbi:hypothetical protein RR46_07019 [Papilio xuthus]|uniref:Uncharacterized protein n=1 Tax=Papilio xuthus TaxID=66420 RepID=A0A194Q4Z4_PAPXU|nr:hypothetical protein RR46_07019 [Papilio xuthus]
MCKSLEDLEHPDNKKVLKISEEKAKAIIDLRNDVKYIHKVLFTDPMGPITEQKKALMMKATESIKLANKYVESLMEDLLS